MVAKINKAGTNAFVLVFSKFMALLLSIVTTMVLTRSLALDEYGTYSELLTISAIGVSVFSLGLPNALNYFLPRCETMKEKQKFVGFYFLLLTILSLILMGAMALANGSIARYYTNEELVRYSYFLIIIPWTKLIISSRSNLFIAEGKVRKEIAYSIANGLMLAVIAFMTTLDNSNFDKYILAYVIVECTFTLLVYFEAWWGFGRKIDIRINRADIKELLKYAIPLGLSTAVSTISLDLDKLIIGYVMDEASVAIYANAGKELPFSLISTSFTAVFLPQIVLLVRDKKTEKALERWKDIIETNYIILSFCVTASIVFAPQIISLLYSEAYLDGVTIFRIYSMTLILRITYWAMILNAFGKTNEILYNSIICLGINVILSIVLYSMFGFVGPAIATFLSIFAIVVLQIVRTSKLLNTSILSIIPFKQFIKPTIVCLISGFALWYVLRKYDIGTASKGILVAIVAGALWGALYLLAFGKRIVGLWKKLNQD